MGTIILRVGMTSWLVWAGVACDGGGEAELESTSGGGELTPSEDASEASATDESASSSDEGELVGHAIGLRATLESTDAGDAYAFLTPSGNVIELSKADVTGKPYYLGIFVGGFAQGVDSALYYSWGQMPANGLLEVVSATEFEPGPYDLVFVVYTQTEITVDPGCCDGPRAIAPTIDPRLPGLCRSLRIGLWRRYLDGHTRTNLDHGRSGASRVHSYRGVARQRV